MKHRQKGSAHIVILVILMIVLLAVLGFVYWKNFISKPDTTKTSITSTTSSDVSSNTPTIKTVNGSIDADFGTKLTFEYPETWKYKSDIQGDKSSSWTQTITMTSPSGKYVVTYKVGAGGGLGGMCAPVDTGTLSSINYSNIPGFSNVSYVEFGYKDMPQNQEGTGSSSYTGYAGLMQSPTAQTVKTGDSVCDTYLKDVLSLKEANNTQLIQDDLTVPSAATPEAFKAALSGKEYEQAKAILLSASH